MSRRPGFLSSSVGTKILIAITGLLLFGFLIGHLVGNLSLLAGDGGSALAAQSTRVTGSPGLGVWSKTSSGSSGSRVISR